MHSGKHFRVFYEGRRCRAKEGKMGLLKTVPEGMPPDSSVANLSILGYDPVKYYTGRGPLEAGAMGIELGERDIAFRCNLVTVKDGILSDYSSGHITTEEAAPLLEEMRKLGVGEYFLGKSYRHVFVLRNSDIVAGCSPPHDIVGEPISKHMIKNGEVGEKLNRLMLKSLEILPHHPVNLKRIAGGKNPGNMIWLWSPGKKPRLEAFHEKFGLRGVLISAVPLIKGIGVYARMELVDVPGATGYYDTNYEGKADYAVKSLEKNDFVFIHVEAPDEAGHEGDPERKIKTIEEMDKRLIGRILDRTSAIKIAVLPDHPTPVDVRLHMRDPVPFVIWRRGMKGDGLKFCEASGRVGSLGFHEGEQFMKKFLKI
ncbi:MAG: cofactor-independent phosphoglycerate mutase [Candidatus Hadarchaeales archaeon]